LAHYSCWEAKQACFLSKKDGTNVLLLVPGGQWRKLLPARRRIGTSSSPEYLHDTIDSQESKYRNRNFLWISFSANRRLVEQSFEGEAAMPTESQEIEVQTRSNLELSDIYQDSRLRENRPSGGLVVAIAAATSALLGGLAAAWYYRRTISRLQQAAENGQDSKFGIPEPTDDDGR
jgi:hypothetical protein